jgi:hypothetical protein
MSRRELLINSIRNNNKSYSNDIEEELIEGFSNYNNLNKNLKINNKGSYNNFNGRIILAILLITIIILTLFKCK